MGRKAHAEPRLLRKTVGLPPALWQRIHAIRRILPGTEADAVRRVVEAGLDTLEAGVAKEAHNIEREVERIMARLDEAIPQAKRDMAKLMAALRGEP